MQALTFLVAALTALSTALPVDTTVPCTAAYEEYMRNASAGFGWQLAGAAKNTDELDATCNELKNGDNCKWADEGLVVDYIAAPVCNTSTAPNAELALPIIVQYNTKVFATLLLNSFDSSNKTTWNYLCDNLRFKKIDNFLLDSQTLINSTCNAGSSKLNPQPFEALGQPNLTALADYKEAASKLFAWEYASFATSSSQLNTMCAHASAKATKWVHLQLDPACVEQTICSFENPLSAEDVKTKMREWSSKQYVTVLRNVSNAPGYQRWLCNNLEADAMSAAGLDGDYVKGVVCGDVGA
ncbi:hypothetical protein DOTSEDRAFT_73409 [Dothistroma septosporum NZE10]|uniref:Uncharacterized protein n=1 Tax=Dothistroma septosporum (strain NZE10 / CBS 128990) TaxID=675120 RepID=N1PJF7_DOTSN|nr:hypothetical protein DOTSEDRAFT_73409 [Dothistroma septosporum NZE10]